MMRGHRNKNVVQDENASKQSSRGVNVQLKLKLSRQIALNLCAGPRNRAETKMPNRNPTLRTSQNSSNRILSVRVSRPKLKLSLWGSRSLPSKAHLHPSRNLHSKRNPSVSRFPTFPYLPLAESEDSQMHSVRKSCDLWMTEAQFQSYLTLATSNVRLRQLRLFHGRLRLTHSKSKIQRLRLSLQGQSSCARVVEIVAAREFARDNGVSTQWKIPVSNRDTSSRLGLGCSSSRQGKLLAIGNSRIHRVGLFAMEPIRRGEFITEYLGEVIRNAVGNVREDRYQRNGIQSTYMFELSPAMILDGTRKGCAARYVNHCCEPNMKPVLVKGGGWRRIGLFGKRNIEKGEELTFDYNFETEDDEKKVSCLCGAKKCRKVMN